MAASRSLSERALAGGGPSPACRLPGSSWLGKNPGRRSLASVLVELCCLAVREPRPGPPALGLLGTLSTHRARSGLLQPGLDCSILQLNSRRAAVHSTSHGDTGDVKAEPALWSS